MWNISEVVMNHVLLSSLLVTFVLAFLSAKKTSLKLSSHGNRSGRFVIIAANKSCVLFLNHF